MEKVKIYLLDIVNLPDKIYSIGVYSIIVSRECNNG